MIEILKNPIDDTFEELIRNTSSEMILASPFVKLPIAELITKAKRDDVSLSFLTNFKLASLYQRATDLEALKLLNQSPKTVLRTNQKLHAKTYIFDSKYALVTSGNLTKSGLVGNFEYGVLMEEVDLIATVKSDFLALFNNKEETAILTQELLDDASTILSRVPAEKSRPELRVAERELRQRIEEQQDVYEGGAESIAEGLSGWKKSVFQVLNKISGITFELDNVYVFEEQLSKEYPDNKFIKDKIRQQLQVLRDLGLVEFLERGKYRKLWT